MKKVLILVACLVMVGCAIFNSEKYTDDIYSPTNPDAITTFSSEPAKDYIKIGEVSVTGDPASNRDNMIEQLKIRAAKMGGDAIFFSTQENMQASVGGGDINTNNEGYNSAGASNARSNAQSYLTMQGIVYKLKK